MECQQKYKKGKTIIIVCNKNSNNKEYIGKEVKTTKAHMKTRLWNKCILFLLYTNMHERNICQCELFWVFMATFKSEYFYTAVYFFFIHLPTKMFSFSFNVYIFFNSHAFKPLNFVRIKKILCFKSRLTVVHTIYTLTEIEELHLLCVLK